MFDIGLPELLLIAAVTLVVLGPEELPRVMLKVGRFVGSIKRQLGSWQDELERAAEEPRKQQPKPDTQHTMLPLEKPQQLPPEDLPVGLPEKPPEKTVDHEGAGT